MSRGIRIGCVSRRDDHTACPLYDIYYFDRGHTVAAVCNSFHLAKDCGFKVRLYTIIKLNNKRFRNGMIRWSVT